MLLASELKTPQPPLNLARKDMQVSSFVNSLK